MIYLAVLVLIIIGGIIFAILDGEERFERDRGPAPKDTGDPHRGDN